MIVTIGKKTYQMSRKEAENLLKIGSEQVPFGIYAVEKNGQIDMKNDTCKSITQLKELIREYKQQGFKVYANKEKGNDKGKAGN